ncbi:DUF4339 domain-containing protein [Rurimicrobium arvi]|uniref:GYF domain-containing protein n=1 Tax=Rurimicrobium arvi TaxID=2049916 RepID=A0ABP8MNB5_9BACT
MKKYYLHESGSQQGPFSLEELKEKEISRDTPVWFDGLPDWTNAGYVDELKDLFVNTPPPFPVASPPPIVNTAINSDKRNADPYAKKDRAIGMRILFGLLIAFVAGGAGYYYIVRQNESAHGATSSYQEKVLSVEEIERATPTDFLSVNTESNENFWGDKIRIKGNISSRATVASYKDVTIRVTYFSKTNTEIGSEDHTIYEIISPGSSVEFKWKVDKNSDVASVRCDLISATAN